MCAGFAAGSTDGHQLINRSERPAIFLVVSNRDAEDSAYYSIPTSTSYGVRHTRANA